MSGRLTILLRQFAPDVALADQRLGDGNGRLGTQANAVILWRGTAIASFINELGVYSGEYAPDFIAFDKFERDCFSPDALAHYGWNATCWFNYLGMVKQAAKDLHKPAMLWQIPGAICQP